jgi:anaerobic selenocysteine-containing dehydrogenase
MPGLVQFRREAFCVTLCRHRAFSCIDLKVDAVLPAFTVRCRMILSREKIRAIRRAFAQRMCRSAGTEIGRCGGVAASIGRVQRKRRGGELLTGVRRTVFRGCTLCEASCGLALELDGDRIVSMRGDEEDALSHGFICAKGVAIADVHNDPDRLRSPMRKTADGKFEAIGWDEAFEIVGKRLKALRARHGADAIAM